MNCRYCGEEVPNDSVFCEYCGKVLRKTSLVDIRWLFLAVMLVIPSLFSSFYYLMYFYLLSPYFAIYPSEIIGDSIHGIIGLIVWIIYLVLAIRNKLPWIFPILLLGIAVCGSISNVFYGSSMLFYFIKILLSIAYIVIAATSRKK